MALFQLIATAWTVWKVATKRVGPVSGLVVTGLVMGGLIYLRPWLTENFPAVGRIVGDTKQKESVTPDLSP